MHASMTMVAEMLEKIGKQEEADVCREYADGAKEAYRYFFVKNDRIDSRRQCKLVRPLAFGLLDGRAEENVAEELAETARDRDYKIGTGFLSTPFILPVLADHGYAKEAYRMLENEKEPGWLAMVGQGATTVWEKYNGYAPDGSPLELSYNHYSPGAVCSFLFQYTAGIHVTGERKFLLKPIPGGTLTWIKTQMMSAYGCVQVEWKLENGTYTYRVVIPSNCSAEVELPDGTKKEVPAGSYCWKWKER